MLIEKNGYRLHLDESKKEVGKIEITVNGKVIPLFLSVSEFGFGDYFITDYMEADYNGNVFVIRYKRENIEAESVIRLTKKGIFRCQRYQVKKDFTGSIGPRFSLADKNVLYTYPLRVYERPVNSVRNIRNDYLWALPLPAHIIHGNGYVATYFIDRENGVGTCDFRNENGDVSLGFHFPDCTAQDEVILPFSETKTPSVRQFKAGESFFFKEYIMYSPLQSGENAVLKAEKLISSILLKRKKAPDYAAAAEGIAFYFDNNDLWNPNALAEGKGWYRNMWKHTHGGVPVKDFYYDLGWGEGYGAITVSALTRYDVNNGTDVFREKIREMTLNADMFLRDGKERGAYYDRYIKAGDYTLLGKKAEGGGCDFLGIKRIWTHSLGMVGYQFAKLYEEVTGYDPEVRDEWLRIATDIAAFLLSKRKENGDIQDGFDETNGEANKKKHRIPARVIVCGLFCSLYRITGDKEYISASMKLAKAACPEIEKYEFYNQMLDGHVDVINGEIVNSGTCESDEIYDSENACYAFVGLSELFGETKDRTNLKLCENCAAYFISWMYFYDIPTGANGYSRGATTCRMPDFPLCYIGAGNFAYRALRKLGDLTGEKLYGAIADEFLSVSAKYQWNDPSVKWHGGVVHAVYQVNGKHWGPDIEGQMDTGMTSGTTLMNLEDYLKYGK
ncbi:MAG: hypothetical protein IJU84_06650 [Clostridia bacterium]|nr:hypothetical protein [Clostridia bacterium]